MADQQETFDQIDSASLFESAMSNEPAQAEVVEHVEEQPRGPDGKFAAKPEAEPELTKEPALIQAESGKDDATIPPWRLREMREERDAARNEAAQFRAEMDQLRRQAAQNAPKPEPVDIFADPNAWAKEQFSPFEQRMQTMQTTLTLRASRAENIAIHGRDAVKAAEDAIDEAVKSRDPDIPSLTAKLKATDDPVGVAIEWHKSRSLLKETGGDLTAYKAKALEDALNDPAFLAKALERANSQQDSGGQPEPKNIIKLPPSVGKIAAAKAAASDGGDMSNESLFANAMR